MEVRLDYALQKPSDFKVCKKCGALNWYEYEECFTCGFEEFDESSDAVSKWVDDEYKYWIETEGLAEEEADGILIEVR